MGKSNAPNSPNYAATASEQGAQNRATALWNNQLGHVNTNGPTGSTWWDGNTLNTQLSPAQQQMQQSNDALGTSAGGYLQGALQRGGAGVDYSSVPGQVYNIDGSVGDNARNAAVNAVYNQYTANLDPQFQRSQTDLETNLTNQGFDPNSDAYKEQMASFQRNKAAAYQQANNAAVVQGQSAQQQAYTQALGNANLNNTSRASVIQQLIQQHQTNQGDLTWLRGFTGTTPPTGASGSQGNAAPADYMGAQQSAYQAALNQANVNNANSSSAWGNAGNAAAIAAMLYAGS